MIMDNRNLKSFRLTQDAEELLKKLARKLGLTQTATLETAIRKLAKQEKVKLEGES